MNKVLNVLGIGVAIIIGVPVILVAVVIYLLFLPFDIICYYQMPYYKDFKNKYQLFVTSKDVVKIYNRIVREKLPIEYFENNDYEYFVKDGQVLLCGRSNDRFEKTDDNWYFIGEESGSPYQMLMNEVIAGEIEMLKPEHRELPVKFLVFYTDITDADVFEQAKECPYFHCVFSVDENI